VFEEEAPEVEKACHPALPLPEKSWWQKFWELIAELFGGAPQRNPCPGEVFNPQTNECCEREYMAPAVLPPPVPSLEAPVEVTVNYGEDGENYEPPELQIAVWCINFGPLDPEFCEKHLHYIDPLPPGKYLYLEIKDGVFKGNIREPSEFEQRCAQPTTMFERGMCEQAIPKMINEQNRLAIASLKFRDILQMLWTHKWRKYLTANGHVVYENPINMQPLTPVPPEVQIPGIQGMVGFGEGGGAGFGQGGMMNIGPGLSTITSLGSQLMGNIFGTESIMISCPLQCGKTLQITEIEPGPDTTTTEGDCATDVVTGTGGAPTVTVSGGSSATTADAMANAARPVTITVTLSTGQTVTINTFSTSFGSVSVSTQPGFTTTIGPGGITVGPINYGPEEPCVEPKGSDAGPSTTPGPAVTAPPVTPTVAAPAAAPKKMKCCCEVSKYNDVSNKVEVVDHKWVETEGTSCEGICDTHGPGYPATADKCAGKTTYTPKPIEPTVEVPKQPPTTTEAECCCENPAGTFTPVKNCRTDCKGTPVSADKCAKKPEKPKPKPCCCVGKDGKGEVIEDCKGAETGAQSTAAQYDRCKEKDGTIDESGEKCKEEECCCVVGGKGQMMKGNDCKMGTASGPGATDGACQKAGGEKKASNDPACAPEQCCCTAGPGQGKILSAQDCKLVRDQRSTDCQSITSDLSQCKKEKCCICEAKPGTTVAGEGNIFTGAKGGTANKPIMAKCQTDADCKKICNEKLGGATKAFPSGSSISGKCVPDDQCKEDCKDCPEDKVGHPEFGPNQHVPLDVKPPVYTDGPPPKKGEPPGGPPGGGPPEEKQCCCVKDGKGELIKGKACSGKDEKGKEPETGRGQQPKMPELPSVGKEERGKQPEKGEREAKEKGCEGGKIEPADSEACAGQAPPEMAPPEECPPGTEPVPEPVPEGEPGAPPEKPPEKPKEPEKPHKGLIISQVSPPFAVAVAPPAKELELPTLATCAKNIPERAPLLALLAALFLIGATKWIKNARRRKELFRWYGPHGLKMEDVPVLPFAALTLGSVLGALGSFAIPADISVPIAVVLSLLASAGLFMAAHSQLKHNKLPYNNALGALLSLSTGLLTYIYFTTVCTGQPPSAILSAITALSLASGFDASVKAFAEYRMTKSLLGKKGQVSFTRFPRLTTMLALLNGVMTAGALYYYVTTLRVSLLLALGSFAVAVIAILLAGRMYNKISKRKK